MKKKLMMVAVLLGALSLGACVDNNETQSVTDVRNAKAEQLQARADMNNAEAQAKAIAANAEATLLSAKAEAQKAAAAKANAEAETIKKRAELVELQKEAMNLKNEAAKIENQKAQAALEAALAQLETTKKQAEYDIAAIAARMAQMEQENAIALLNLQAQLLAAQQDLVDYEAALAAAKTQAEKDAIEAERLQLTILSNNYYNAVIALLNAQDELTSLQKQLVEAEAGLAGPDAAAQKQIAQYEAWIAQRQAEIEVYKKYTNYKSAEELDKLKADYAALNAKSGQLKDNYLKEAIELNGVQVDNTAWEEATEAVYNDSFYKFLQGWTVTPGEEEGTVKEWYINGWPLDELPSNYKYNWNAWINNYWIEIAENGVENHSETYYADSLSLGYGKHTADARVLALAVDERVASREEWKKIEQEEQKVYQADYNGTAANYYKKNDWGWYDRIALEEGKTIRNAVDSTLYLKGLYDKETDAEKKAELKSLYTEALDAEQWIAERIANCADNIAYYDEQILVFNTFLANYKNFDANLEALQKKIDAANEAAVAVQAERIAAWKEARAAYWAWQDVNVEMDAMGLVLNGGNGMNGAEDLANAIASRENTIEWYKERIEALQSVEGVEEWIAQLELLIDAQKAVVKVNEMAVEEAKAELDAAMPQTETEE